MLTTSNEAKTNSLTDKEFKVLAIRILTKLGKETNEHSQNFNKKLENIFLEKNQSELKNTVSEMRNTLEGKKRRLGDTEEHISDLEDRRMQIIHYKNSKKKGKFKNENSLNGLWGNIKHINHQVPEVPEEETEKRVKYVSDEIMAGNFPKLKKETYPGRRSIEGPIPNEMNSETHIKTSHN